MKKRDFAEFKSIFVSEDILSENERHANIVTASTMLNLFWMCFITWVLVLFRVFKVGINVMNIVLISSILLLLIPSIICYIKKGNGKLMITKGLSVKEFSHKYSLPEINN